MKKIKVFEAWGAVENESGIPSWHKIASFLNWEVAHKACENKYDGWAGEKDGEVRENTIEIYETYAEYQKVKKQRIKEAVLEKLSQEEREALGL